MDESVLTSIAAVLNKPPALRLETETRQVADWLKRKVKLLEQVSMEILMALVKECGSETRLENELIIREGDIGDCMYILLSGSASVHQSCDLDQEREEKFSKFEKPSTPLCDSKIAATERPSISCAERLGEIISDFNELGPCVGILYSGAIFGEVALIETCRRTASIIAISETSTALPSTKSTEFDQAEPEHDVISPKVAVKLVVISRTLYDNTVRSALEQQFRQKMDFVNRVSYFCRLTSRTKKQIVLGLELQTFEFGTHIISSGSPYRGIYFLLR
ncbi:hypothetical protein EG68_02520 [Paragonimus skrjabini miyazakii]|uniref:Cyclic nucleotide-binding domain-containing protein n=1 Tax=Paragonimus skrjabini miyazakii TaxID=59628 RepID=A0A8S9Z210_9TREM|nr:hypothetical protein EG68_02520 [Paragonimus skrjabini miyazakii]